MWKFCVKIFLHYIDFRLGYFVLPYPVELKYGTHQVVYLDTH